MSHIAIEVPSDHRHTGRRAGYVIAILVNLVMLGLVWNILELGWLPFLTEEFASLVPWISFSLIVTMAVNGIYLVDDRPDVTSAGQFTLNLISLMVTYRMWQVFPFDFSTYEFDWALLTRVMLVLAMVGLGAALLAEAVKLTSRHIDRKGGSE